MTPEQHRPWRASSRAGTALNLLLLALVFWGYAEAERWRTAWLLVAAPIAVAVLACGWPLFNEE